MDLMGIVAIIGLIEKAASGIGLIVKAVEAIFGPGTGAVKKEAATMATKGLISTMVEVSGGGQKETWQKLESAQVDALVGSVVETAVAGMKAMQDYRAASGAPPAERSN